MPTTRMRSRRRHEIERAEDELRVVEHELRGLGQRRARLAHVDVRRRRTPCSAARRPRTRRCCGRASARDGGRPSPRRRRRRPRSARRRRRRATRTRQARVALTVHRETAAPSARRLPQGQRCQCHHRRRGRKTAGLRGQNARRQVPRGRLRRASASTAATPATLSAIPQRTKNSFNRSHRPADAFLGCPCRTCRRRPTAGRR